MKHKLLTRINKLVAGAALAALLAPSAKAQVLFSSGSPYTQNFDTALAAAGSWVDNTTMLGWYAARGNGTGTMGPITTFNFGTGSGNGGGLYSLGVAGINSVNDRALGSLCSGTTGNQAYGVRFKNDLSGLSVTNITITYTGEQWRNGGVSTGSSPSAPQPLAFSYFKNSSAITSPDPSNTVVWASVSALTFVTPTTNTTSPTTGAAIDGNSPTNRAVLTATITGLIVGPGEEVFFRWVDVNDANNDHVIALDDLSISWTTVAANNAPPTISQQPTSVTNYAGNGASFSVTASGKSPLAYQWYYTNAGSTTLISGANASSISFSMITNDNAGGYFVVVTNDVPGVVTSSVAKLVVKPAVVTNIAYLHSLLDANYALTDTNTLYQVSGIVTTAGNLVQGGTVYSFYIQDSTGGINVFHRGGFAALGQINSDLPTLGQIVTVTAPLLQFNGTLEVLPVAANPAHSLILSNNDVSVYSLPQPATLDLASLTNFALMETNYEGRLVKVLNVTLDTTLGTFAAQGTTTSFNITNAALATMQMFVPGPANDLHGQAIPAAASSIVGVISQNKSGSPFTGSYSLNVTAYADITAAVLAPTLSAQVLSGSLVLNWGNAAFYLQSSTNVAGPYNYVDGATSPFTNNVSSKPAEFFRLTSTAPVPPS